MRSLLTVIPLLLVVLPFARGLAAVDNGDGTPMMVVPVSASTPDGDAAARHAKRTACLKEAKARKLIGAQKAAFLKECFAAP